MQARLEHGLIVGVIQTYMEAARIAGAVRSLFDVGCDRVFVLDGAWVDETGRPFGDGPLFSTDGTVEEAEAAGATVGRVSCGNDAAKQTALLRDCGAEPGDMVVKIDSDEIIRGQLPEITEHSMIMLANHGPNDIPDVRGSFPRGDDSDRPIPLFRVFAWRPDLVCERPGRWVTDDGPLEPYRVGALRRRIDELELAYDDPISVEYRWLRDHEHTMTPSATAAFPVLDGVWIDHYRDDRNAVAKVGYYEAAAA